MRLGGRELAVGGAGWHAPAAEAACVGEAVERCEASPALTDQVVEASARSWALDEAPVEPDRWVLFHNEQYALPEFPFRPFTRDTMCRWVCFREARSGTPRWVPEEFTYLELSTGAAHRISPLISTGLACGQAADSTLLRALQEVIERDAVVGAWWGRYRIEEWEHDEVLCSLDPSLPYRLLRPNLTYRFYRVDSSYSAHVTVVTLQGEDREGFCFSIGSACRATRQESWEKAILEAVQGRHYVRYLKGRRDDAYDQPVERLADFAAHAVYYSLHPERLAETVLERPSAVTREGQGLIEGLAALAERLVPRPVLFRNLTPPRLASEVSGWIVIRAVVPGLQPLHGNHHLPHLGGLLWAPRGLADWGAMPPHPFP